MRMVFIRPRFVLTETTVFIHAHQSRRYEIPRTQPTTCPPLFIGSVRSGSPVIWLVQELDHQAHEQLVRQGALRCEGGSFTSSAVQR